MPPASSQQQTHSASFSFKPLTWRSHAKDFLLRRNGTARHHAALGYAENSFRMCVVWLKIKQSAAFGAALNNEQRAYIINCTQLAWPGRVTQSSIYI